MSEYFAVDADADVCHVSHECRHIANTTDIVVFETQPEGTRLCLNCNPKTDRYYE